MFMQIRFVHEFLGDTLIRTVLAPSLLQPLYHIKHTHVQYMPLEMSCS